MHGGKALFPVKQLVGRIRAWWTGLFAVKQRRVRNWVFVACVGGIALSALLALFTAIWSSARKNVPLLLFAEILAFWCFGIAWFVKGVARMHTAGRRHSRRTCWRLGACHHRPVLITWWRALRKAIARLLPSGGLGSGDARAPRQDDRQDVEVAAAATRAETEPARE